MNLRAIVAMIAFSAMPASAFADDLAGSWRVQTGDIRNGRGCTLEGALVLKEGSSAARCELTLVQQCAGEKGKHLIVRETCSFARKGDDILIKGTSYEIIDAKPRRSWADSYKLDTFYLKLQPDGATMKGRFEAIGHSWATFTRMQDLAE